MGSIWKMFIFHKKNWKKICYHSNHDNICITFCERSWYFFYILALKIIYKKWVWFENFSFYTNYWEQICCHGNHDNMCKTFCEHSWFFFLILTLKIIINKMGNWFEKFSNIIISINWNCVVIFVIVSIINIEFAFPHN
jgi:hypothetical protein